MNDSENRDNKPKVLGIKGGTNTVRQSFSHGRSKAVVVETRRKKLLVSKKGPLIEENAKPAVAEDEAKENDEILRRKKAIEASKAEKKNYRNRPNNIKRLKRKNQNR